MTKSFFILPLVLLTTLADAQSDCSTYFAFQEGVELSYGYYNHKDKLQSTSSQRVNEIITEGDVTTAIITTKSADAKGKNPVEGTYEVSCSDGVFSVDMSEFLPPQATAAMGGGEAEVTVNGDGLKLPTEYEPGQIIPDSETTITIQVGGALNMNITVLMSNQELVGNESITTPAGTFDCLKFSYQANTEMMLFKNESHIESWYANGIGTVMTITKNKKGSVVSKMILEGYSK